VWRNRVGLVPAGLLSYGAAAPGWSQPGYFRMAQPRPAGPSRVTFVWRSRARLVPAGLLSCGAALPGWFQPDKATSGNAWVGLISRTVRRAHSGRPRRSRRRFPRHYPPLV
jgi:hypothetical protein